MNRFLAPEGILVSTADQLMLVLFIAVFIDI